MRTVLTLIPDGHHVSLAVNYNHFLTSLIYSILKRSSKDFSTFLHDEGFRLGESRKGFKLFTYSMLTSKTARIVKDRIHFGKGAVRWQISSPVDDFIQHLINGVFAEGQEIRIGPEGKEVTFFIERVETQPKPEIRSTMRFTCLSPITVSKVLSSSRFNRSNCSNDWNSWNGSNSSNGSNGSNSSNGSNGSNGFHCYYLRPWDDDLSEYIRKNLVKKYRLIHGRDIDPGDFSIRIDSDYMNKRAGKIMKKINFKGTDIIGFLAPFEVTGNPELIEIGYETGFGEKGSMGFGMVQINNRSSCFTRSNSSNG